MKKAILFLLFFQILLVNSQVTSSQSQLKKSNFEPGVYTSNAKGQNIKLTINHDKTYDMSFFFGKYDVKNDTIYFNNFSSSQKFIVKPIKDAPFSSTIKLKLNYDLSYYYSTQVYIGTQSDDNRAVTFKPVKDYFSEDNSDVTQQNIIVEKSKYLYLVDAKYDQTTVFKFQIPDNVHEAELEYNLYTNSETKLSGYIDSKTNEFVISDGKTPILFDFIKEDSGTPKIKNDILAIEVKDEKNWLKANGFENDQATEESVEAYKPPYVFTHKRTTSLSNSLSEIKKTPTKFLVVVYDSKNKNNKTEYDAFIKESEEAISSYMYSEYVASYDNFNFYLASDKDKTLLIKNKINSNQELLVLNSKGELVYHTGGTITDKKELFSTYNSIFKEVSAANDKLEFDSLMNAKNTSVKELKTAFRKTLNTETSYAVMPPPAVEVVKFDPPVVMDSQKTDEIKEVVEEVVDSAATAVEAAYDYNYDIIKDKENLYELKSTKEVLLAKWKKVFDDYKIRKTYDKEFVQLIKAELSRTGFSQRMFSTQHIDTSDMDFEMLDYVFANYKSLSEPPVEPYAGETLATDAVVEEATYEPYYYEQDIDSALNTFFTNSNYGQNIQIQKVLNYYKKYLEISGFSTSAVENYMNALKLNKNSGTNEKEYLETFENYFNSIVKPNTSVIENLDTAFSKKPQNDYLDWSTYKISFANLANDVCWHLVENSKDTSFLQKAIKWSETSLLLEKNNHYYLDTLAQIYYKNGLKQKAIETEQKAIDATQDGSDTGEYKIVLEKMKNGTY